MTTITIHQGRTPELIDADVRVVIDVIRAFTTTHVALRRGALRIAAAGTVEEARALAALDSSRILAGERNALPPDGFDLGNSPAEFDGADLDGREVVLTTSNGVQATLHAWHEGPLVVTGFSNAGSTVDYLRSNFDDPHHRIQLVASHPDGDEDMACAEWIRARLLGLASPSDEKVERRIFECRAAQKFLDPSRQEYRADDIDYCAHRDDSPWVMGVERRNGQIVILRWPLR